MSELSHERLEVYQYAVRFLVLADEVVAGLPAGRAYVGEQLRRAALSILLNIAEGAGEFAPADKARFYRMARRSATECAAVLDACRVLGLAEPQGPASGRSLLTSVVAMLTSMVLRLEGRGRGSGSGRV